jgi:ribosomal protein S26
LRKNLFQSFPHKTLVQWWRSHMFINHISPDLDLIYSCVPISSFMGYAKSCVYHAVACFHTYTWLFLCISCCVFACFHYVWKQAKTQHDIHKNNHVYNTRITMLCVKTSKDTAWYTQEWQIMINKTNTTQKRNQTLLKTGRWTQLVAMEWLAVPGSTTDYRHVSVKRHEQYSEHCVLVAYK